VKNRLLLIGILCLGCAAAASAQNKKYSPKNGVLNLKAIVFGGGFRVISAIPMHGNFARYTRLEIARAESLIGKAAGPDVLNKLLVELRSEFERGGRFASISTIDFFSARDAAASPQAAPREDFREADALDAPMRTWNDLVQFDRQRENAAESSESGESAGTLVVTSQIIDYAKGNKVLQLLPLDIGNGILSVRFSYFDKNTGEELGRSVISSDNSSKVVPSFVSPRTAITGIAEGLVDQVTRRKVSAER
jgi:hypothetical protein